jgi:hypothetical protein
MRDIQKLMKIAGADDPEEALAKEMTDRRGKSAQADRALPALSRSITPRSSSSVQGALAVARAYSAQ